VTTIVETIPELRAICDRARSQSSRGGEHAVGLVPTMGYLHEGHRSLMRAARDRCDLVVVTIFVNPMQFGAGEDLDRYPRDLDGDVAACAGEGVDVVFHPSVAEMYPLGPSATTVHVADLTAGLCGADRPVHFDGVTTVVAKLFAIAGPCTAFFGEKDFQQLVVVRRMAADLNLPVEVVGCPLVREPDGLAMSSRNAYLSPEGRVAGIALSRALESAGAAVADGERDAAALRALVAAQLAAEPLLAVDYVEVRSADDLGELDRLDGRVVVAVAARVGGTRLIDNVRMNVQGSDVEVDLGVRATAGAPRGRNG
jgi:pantoate--beta-alanine ligase